MIRVFTLALLIATTVFAEPPRPLQVPTPPPPLPFPSPQPPPFEPRQRDAPTELEDRLRRLDEETQKQRRELRDPLLGDRVFPLPPISPLEDNAPVDDDGNLLVDVGFGLKDEKDAKVAEATVRSRLAAIAFAVNSVNTTKKTLLTVDELMKKLYPEGKFKAGDVPTAKIRLSDFLVRTQIERLREALSAEPLNCAPNRPRKAERRPPRRRGRTPRDRPFGLGLGLPPREPVGPVPADDDGELQAEPLRADVIVKAMLDQENYYKILELDDDRRGFEIDLGISDEFGGDPTRKDPDAIRVILPPGKSGVAHDNAQRLIVVQKTSDGRTVIRTGDVDRNEASKGNRNFIQRPGTATPSGSEEIWELPNGMRAYSARNGEGKLISQVPHGLVKPKITNPGSCFSCHGGTGFIGGSGEFGSLAHTKEKPIKKINVVDESFAGKVFGNKNLFKADWDDYMAAIAPANTAYEKALALSGTTPKDARNLVDKYSAMVSPAKLAMELGADPDDVERALLSKRFRSAWDPSGDFDPKNKDAKIELTRASLESEVDLGPGKGEERIKKPLYCVVKDLSKDQQTKGFRQVGDALARAKKTHAPSM